MWSAQKGETVVLELEVRTRLGAYADPESVTIEVTDPHGVTTGSSVERPVLRTGEGRYFWDFPVPASGPEGLWRSRAQVRYGGSRNLVAITRLSFRVEG